MTVTSKPNSVTGKIAEGQVEAKPLVNGNIMPDAAARSGKPGGQAKRKKVDEDDILNSNAHAEEGGAAELAEAQEGPILLAQAGAATATDAAAASSTAGAEAGAAGAAAGSGAAAGAAAGTAAISVGTMALIGAGIVGVAAAASGGGAAAAVASATGFTVGGTIALGKINDNTGLTIEAYKADGTLLTTSSAVVNNDGTFSIVVTENYSGPVLIRLVDTSPGTNYMNEGTGGAASIGTDLRAVVNVGGNGAVTVNVTPLTELAVRELLGDSGGAAGTAVTTLGSKTAADVSAANTAVAQAFGLTGEITAITPVTVDDAAGFAAGSAAQQSYGQVLAAIAGAEATLGGTGAVLDAMAQGMTGSAVDQSVVDLLIAGAITADGIVTNVTGAAAALRTVIGSNVSGLDISADTGNDTDFITQTAAQTVTATLDAALSSAKLWGSVDGGTTWTDISASAVTGTALSWATTLSGTSSIKLAVTADTVTAFTGAAADLVAGTKIVSQGYSVDTTAPAFSSAATAIYDENGTGIAYRAAVAGAEKVTYAKSGGADMAVFALDAASGALTFNAAPNFEAGQTAFTIDITATDGAGNAATQTVTINVTDVNEAPAFASGTATANFAENGTGTVYTAAATDPDASTTLTYTLSGTDAALFDINASTGAVTFKAAPNFEVKADAGADNVYDVTVTASDGTLSASQTLAVTVTDINETPVLTSGTTASLAENATGTVYTAAATDQDAGATLTYALGGTDAASFAIAPNTGVVTFVSPPNYEVKNSYSIDVTASDGTNTTTPQTVAVSVTNVNEAPSSTTISGQTAVVSQNYNFDAAASFSDVDAGDTLTFGATGLPAGLSINTATGIISGTATTENLTNSVTVTATDAGGLTTSQTFNVAVVSAPTITAISANVTEAKTGDALTFTATISEAVTVAGTPTLTLDVGGTPMTATYTGGTGTNSLTFNATASAGDDATVTVSAISLGGGSITGNVSGQAFVTSATGQTVSSFVIDNSNPAFTSATTANAAENQTAAYTAAVTDATAVIYALGATGDNTLFSINSSTGAVTFNAAPNREAAADAGGDNVYNITVTATDALGHAASQDVAITVTDVNEAPTSSPATSTDTFVVNQPISGNVVGLFTDVDAGDTLTYSQTGLPAGITLDPNTGAISGTPTATGTAEIVFTATDSGGLSVSHTVTVSIVSAPTITNIATLDGVTNLDVRSDLVLTFSDTIALGSGQIRIMDDMGTAGWTLTNTTTAESKQDVTDNDVVITLTNGAVTALAIGGVDKSAEMADSVTVSGNTLVISPAGSDNVSSTDWDFDWDFGADYHVELDAGVVTANGVGNVAINDSTTLNFTTVTPTGDATGAASQAMAADGTLTAGYTWHHGHVQDATANGLAMDFSVGSHALMIQSNGLDVATDKSSTTVGGKVLLSGLGTDDIIYMDNGGDMSFLTTDGHKGANYTGSGNTNARLLDNSDGGTQFQTVFADYANTGYTAITALGGADTMLENITHYNANIVIFG